MDAYAYEPYMSLGMAAAAGLLVGLERERSAPEGDRSTFPGGARTHPLVAIGGALSVLLARQAGPLMIALPFAAVVTFLGIGYASDLRAGKARGITSEIAMVVSFLLGALAAASAALDPPSRRLVAVAATAVVVTLLLSAKPLLRPFAHKISQTDVVATLKFLIVAVLVLPLVPNAPMGPLGALNPFRIFVFVVLVAAVDFVGYASMRLLGAERGLGLTGLVGGLASSTATTLSMSRRAQQDPANARACLLGVLLAGAIMFVRVLALVAVAGPPGLLGAVLVPIGAMAVAALAQSGLLYARGRGARSEAAVDLVNPFELSAALKFGVFFALVLVGSKAAALYLGSRGTYAAAVVAGFADVDAITLSVSSLAGGALAERVAALAVVLAAASNTAVKALLAIASGGWAFGRWVALTFALTLLAGLAAAVAIW